MLVFGNSGYLARPKILFHYGIWKNNFRDRYWRFV